MPRGGPERKVFLIGFMASGKSTVGPALASRLGLPFVDLDKRLERAERRGIARIFREDGEARFRALEAAALARACRGSAAVVAAGGGAVLLERNVRRMRAAGLVVWLRATRARLWARARRDGLDKRPLLSAAGPARARRTLNALLAARTPLYRRAAHLAVSSAGAAGEIARRIARRGRLRRR